MNRYLFALTGALLGATAAALVWWPLLGVFALVGGVDRSMTIARSPLGVVVIGVLPALGLIHGAIIGAVRCRLSGDVLLEMAASPFAWVMTAGDGMVGGLVMLLSLVPGACAGAMLGLWLAGTPTGAMRWPDEAGIGAVIGVALSLVALNLYVQWPTFKSSPTTPVQPGAGSVSDGQQQPAAAPAEGASAKP